MIYYVRPSVDGHMRVGDVSAFTNLSRSRTQATQGMRLVMSGCHVAWQSSGISSADGCTAAW
jgi:hypothetical protein